MVVSGKVIVEQELAYLEKWIHETESGGWSTQNLQEMKDRATILKAWLYEAEKAWG